jgi:hypothetical protein
MTDQASSLISRRNLIAGAAVAGALATGARAVPLRAVLRSLPKNGPVSVPMLVSLTAQSSGNWALMVGTSFTLVTEDGRNLALTLTQVTALPVSGTRPGSLRGQPFSVRFTGPVLPAGNKVYTIIHPNYGALTLFFDAATSAGITAQFN